MSVVTDRPWRDLDPRLFRFTTDSADAAELRDLYLALMTAFERSAVLAPVLNVEGVRAALTEAHWFDPVTDERLVQALGALVRWGLLDVTQDHSAHYATPEEFERRNLQWSLTPKGEAAIAGVHAALDSLRHVASLQPAVLDRIGDDQAEIAAHLAAPATTSTDEDVYFRLANIETQLAGLIVNVRQFNRALQQLVGQNATDDAFVEVKRHTITYLEEFVDGVERPIRRIHDGIEAIGGSTSDLFDRAVRGARLPPATDDDPTVPWIAERHRHWDALRSWFAPATGTRPRVTGMIDLARTAINQLLRVLERRHAERRRSASLADDFRALAGLFATAATTDDAHRLYGAAFGMWPARHAHLPSVDGTARRPHDPWGATEPVEVAPALRTTGTVTNRGRPRPVRDPAAHRAARLLAETERMLESQRVLDALHTDGEVRLSTLVELDTEPFAELFSLIGLALDAERSSDDTHRAQSVDGRVEIVLGRPDGTATVTTATGTMTAPDFVVDIRVTSSTIAAGAAQRHG